MSMKIFLLEILILEDGPGFIKVPYLFFVKLTVYPIEQSRARKAFYRAPVLQQMT